MKINVVVLCSILSCLFFKAYAQGGEDENINVSDFTKMIEVLPPAPDAASLGKYGGAAPSISTGEMSLNIPIYEYRSIHLSLPISLSYSTNGFKVDEIATRVGTSWNLLAGGVVSHTVMGGDDNSTQRLIPPADFNVRDRALVDYLVAVSIADEAAFDSQPDLYSFNFVGNNGQFILDNNLNPVLLTHSNLKLEKDFDGSDWNVRITTGDGIQYLFGGSQATEFTRKFQSGTSCGKSYSAFVPTAYYLNKIIHPNRDTIRLSYSGRRINYKTGISQTFFNYDQTSRISSCVYPFYGGCPQLNNSACVSWMTTNAVLLDEITSTGGIKVKFRYINRLDGTDRLVSRIEIRESSSNIMLKSFKLEYQTAVATDYDNFYSEDDELRNRPFLSRLTEQSSDSTFTKSHSFYYTDIANLPPRLSFSQDDYGFFNGKTNSSLAPLPSSLAWQRELPDATADRSPDFQFSSKGLLYKIVYPTGGYDSIEYGGNYSFEPVTTYPATQEYSVNATSTDLGGPGTTNSSADLPVSFGQEAPFKARCTFIGEAGTEDEIHNKALVKLVKSDGSFAWSGYITPGNSVDVILNLEEGETYTIVATAYGIDVVAYGSLTYKPGTSVTQYVNKEVGGTTVSRVITKDYLSGKIEKRKYYYTRFPDLSTSSAFVARRPVYERYHRVYSSCSQPDTQEPGGIVDCGYNSCFYWTIYSNTQSNIYAASGSPVIYGTVVESLGDNFENGGIEHSFEQSPDVPGQIILGSSFLGAPFTSYSWKNGRELYTHYFKKVNNVTTSVRKQYFHYLDDSRINTDFKSYVVNKRYGPVCLSEPPSEDEINGFDCIAYAHLQRWTYPDTVRTVNYDASGQITIKQAAYTERSNVNHVLPTRVTTWTSDGQTHEITSLYPQDLVLTGAQETARQTLISNNIISPVLEQNEIKAGNQLIKLKTEYNVFSNNNLVLPSALYTQIANNPLESRIEFTRYDDYGQVLEQSKTKDAKQSYIWGYKNAYPIAKVENAGVAEIAYTSFEVNSEGNWIFAGIPINDQTSPTGIRVYNLESGSLQKTSLNSSSSYTLSYFYKTGASVTVSGGTHSDIISRPYKDGWQFRQQKITGTTVITLSGTGFIDEVRLHPVMSHMSTYTYDPMIGMTSVTDINNVTTYYEYDTFGRLEMIKDAEGNIVKHNKYIYKTSSE